MQSLEADSEDVYIATRFETYLQRQPVLEEITYPDFYKWFRRATSEEQRKAERMTANGSVALQKTKCADQTSQTTLLEKL